MRHTLEIFPDKPRAKPGEQHNEVQVVFKDKETKDKYIKQERLFTLAVFNYYLTAMPSNRNEAQRALDLKRVVFAKQNNYYPQNNTPMRK